MSSLVFSAAMVNLMEFLLDLVNPGTLYAIFLAIMELDYITIHFQ